MDVSVNLPDSNRIVPIHAPGLPAELLDQINDVYLLHILATGPSRILPPGKSLLSVLSSRKQRASNPRVPPSLKDQITDVIKRAFWDEALESLSSQTPAVQLTRIRLLYNDIRTAVTPLIPRSHPIIDVLSNPLSPTSSPLRSASSHLLELLSVLRERCAPARDENVDVLIRGLQGSSLSDLPRTIVDTVKGIFDLVDIMKEDLADFVIGTWTEQEARQWVRQTALDHERKTTTDIFSTQIIRESYYEWLAHRESNSSGMNALVNRLMEALCHASPVSPFPPSENTLPPIFIFVAFDLVKIQNILQALVILASLRSIAHLFNNNSSDDWIPRVWALLEAEIERGGTEPAETKLLNLEDEVVWATGVLGDDTNERKLREAVKRTLRLQDPVFVLLQKRLTSAICERLTSQEEVALHGRIPSQMRTGSGVLAKMGEKEDGIDHMESDLVVKGFEDPTLEENVKRAVLSLRACIQWTVECWGRILSPA